MDEPVIRTASRLCALSLGLRGPDVEDAEQEGLLAACLCRPDPPLQVVAARRAVIDLYRRIKDERDSRAAGVDVESLAQKGDDYGAADARVQVEMLLARMDRPVRLWWELRLEGLGAEDAADALGICRRTAQRRTRKVSRAFLA